jgi:hypothetical protein
MTPLWDVGFASSNGTERVREKDHPEILGLRANTSKE